MTSLPSRARPGAPPARSIPGMDPQVQSALIAAAATLVGVGGTVTVAIAAARNSRRTNQATIDAARDDARRNLDVALESYFADRYSRALEQVGSSNLDVRIGGIYALEGIALVATQSDIGCGSHNRDERSCRGPFPALESRSIRRGAHWLAIDPPRVIWA